MYTINKFIILIFVVHAVYIITTPMVSEALSLTDKLPNSLKHLLGIQVNNDNGLNPNDAQLSASPENVGKVRVKRDRKFIPMWKMNVIRSMKGKRPASSFHRNWVPVPYVPKPRPICPANTTTNGTATAGGNSTAPAAGAANATEGGAAPAPAARRRKRSYPVPCEPAPPSTAKPAAKGANATAPAEAPKNETAGAR